eukprot:GHVR01124162.1.p1 GENE.GHVR01124162.1~~GHVR01124162.1.p1  ORF type:complete len:498 (+),score=157.45 GHVR01124162.1:796-2289(+)
MPVHLQEFAVRWAIITARPLKDDNTLRRSAETCTDLDELFLTAQKMIRPVGSHPYKTKVTHSYELNRFVKMETHDDKNKEGKNDELESLPESLPVEAKEAQQKAREVFGDVQITPPNLTTCKRRNALQSADVWIPYTRKVRTHAHTHRERLDSSGLHQTDTHPHTHTQAHTHKNSESSSVCTNLSDRIGTLTHTDTQNILIRSDTDTHTHTQVDVKDDMCKVDVCVDVGSDKNVDVDVVTDYNSDNPPTHAITNTSDDDKSTVYKNTPRRKVTLQEHDNQVGVLNDEVDVLNDLVDAPFLARVSNEGRASAFPYDLDTLRNVGQMFFGTGPNREALEEGLTVDEVEEGMRSILRILTIVQEWHYFAFLAGKFDRQRTGAVEDWVEWVNSEVDSHLAQQVAAYTNNTAKHTTRTSRENEINKIMKRRLVKLREREFVRVSVPLTEGINLSHKLRSHGDDQNSTDLWLPLVEGGRQLVERQVVDDDLSLSNDFSNSDYE